MVKVGWFVIIEYELSFYTWKFSKMKVIILTGATAGRMRAHGDIRICMPSANTQRIQEGHLLVEHILCELAEASILPKVNKA